MNSKDLLPAVLIAATFVLAVTLIHAPRAEPPQVLMEARSPQWPTVRAAYMRGNPVCEACGSKDGVEVHHIVPFSEDPSLELEITNLITLCRKGRNCHFRLGHRCEDGKSNWTCENPDVRNDASRQLWELYGKAN